MSNNTRAISIIGIEDFGEETDLSNSKIPSSVKDGSIVEYDTYEEWWGSGDREWGGKSSAEKLRTQAREESEQLQCDVIYESDGLPDKLIDRLCDLVVKSQHPQFFDVTPLVRELLMLIKTTIDEREEK